MLKSFDNMDSGMERKKEPWKMTDIMKLQYEP